MALDPPSGSQSQHRISQGKTVFAMFPPFHAAFLNVHLSTAISFGTAIIHPLAGPVPSAQGLVEGLQHCSADAAFVPPKIVQEIGEDPRLLDYCCEHLEMVLYGGGDLPQSIGDKVASKVRLVNQFGVTELGMTANLLANNRGWEDWKYCQFHPDLGAEFEPVADNVYELHIKHDPEKEEQQPAFTLYPNVEDFTSHDLFVPHPSAEKPNLWTWCGRSDDIIVFLNGEKTNPVSMEQHIVASNSSVSAALVVGAQRFQAALLIEPAAGKEAASTSEKAALIEEIWPSIAESNEKCPKHAQITRSHILFTQPEKPMLRASKGTVQRAGTLQQYADEINALYSHAEDMTNELDAEIPNAPHDVDDDSIARFIRELVSSSINQSHLKDTDNFLSLGVDSLQALIIVRKLRQGLKLPGIAPSTLYTNPSISRLASAIVRLWKEQNTRDDVNGCDKAQERTRILGNYRDMIDQITASTSTAEAEPQSAVILTGSTGGLGSYILHTLLDQKIAHIYCLNRAQDSLGLQIERNKGRGLPTDFDSCRVSFLTTDLSQPSLGLPLETYQKMLSSTTHIIHNAWPVNFNLPLSSFQPHLDGLVNLIKFAASSARSPYLFYLSSISSVMSYQSENLKTLEELILADSAPGPNGYAESKWLSECLLDHAAHHLAVNTSFARVGQVAGAVDHAGLWNKSEWFPSLVLSSRHIGAIPASLGSTLGKIDWVPIDKLAEVIVDLALNCGYRGTPGTSSKGAAVFHPLNPKPTTWEAIRDVLIDEISPPARDDNCKEKMELVATKSWLARIRKSMEAMVNGRNNFKDEDLASFLEENPAAKLLDFFEETLLRGDTASNELEIDKTLQNSEKLRGIGSIRPEWIRKWVREWLDTIK
ncbi:hypothetical protein ACLMJK_001061 [Lecanora helva]